MSCAASTSATGMTPAIELSRRHGQQRPRRRRRPGSLQLAGTRPLPPVALTHLKDRFHRLQTLRVWFGDWLLSISGNGLLPPLSRRSPPIAGGPLSVTAPAASVPSARAAPISRRLSEDIANPQAAACLHIDEQPAEMSDFNLGSEVLLP